MKWWLLGLGALALLMWVPAAEAQAMGPCEGTVSGAELTQDGQRVVVPADGTVDYEFTAQAPVRSWDVAMDFGGFDTVVSEGTSDSQETTISGSADVSDYARYGAGLYEVDATVRLADGSTCNANILIEVDQNPLATAAGWVAVAAGAGGIAMAAGGSAVAAKAALAAML